MTRSREGEKPKKKHLLPRGEKKGEKILSKPYGGIKKEKAEEA